MAVVRWQPADERLGDRLVAELTSGSWVEAWFISAWAKASAVLRLRPGVQAYRAGGGDIHAIVGIDRQGTTVEALELITAEFTTALVYHNPGPSTFHTKLYFFVADDAALVFVGSNNLTAGGMYTNVETLAEIAYDFDDASDRASADALKAQIADLSNAATSPVLALDAAAIGELTARGLIVPEASLPTTPATGSAGQSARTAGLFTHVPVPPPPPLPAGPRGPTPIDTTPGGRQPRTPPPVTPVAVTTTNKAFVMTLGPRDTRTQAGYSRDVYIPIAARDFDSAFWAWPGSFVRTTGTIGTYDERRPVAILHAIGSTPVTEDRRLYFYHEKSEFRFNAGPLIDGASAGDIIVFEQSSTPGAEYEVSVVAQGTAEHAKWMTFATNTLPSGKRWGYV